ncbi:MAG: Holliday junction branch migration protein RuvA [Rickettsiales bacterium]|nr:Holliday junction branch migration protein RuvA [Rickettsiales bacterium]
MIGKLRGLIDQLADDHAIIDVNGVGYQVFASSRVLGGLQGMSQEVTFWIETHVREDHIHLYGFLSEADRQWFRTLTQVQGVGSKMALSLLGAMSTDEIANAIAAQDKTALTRANGVGPRLAERLITELKNKLPAMAASAISLPVQVSGKGSKAKATPEDPLQAARQEAISALVNLGYTRVDAFSAVARVMQEHEVVSIEQIIPHCLRLLAA